ncbi:hypothetical protein BC828DRAFT_17159 [Blastocladiella britannica]|nr:hypothetical protein BC828DRAFT_17159 [Blastocladiella britannica]
MPLSKVERQLRSATDFAPFQVGRPIRFRQKVGWGARARAVLDPVDTGVAGGKHNDKERHAACSWGEGLWGGRGGSMAEKEEKGRGQSLNYGYGVAHDTAKRRMDAAVARFRDRVSMLGGGGGDAFFFFLLGGGGPWRLVVLPSGGGVGGLLLESTRVGCVQKEHESLTWSEHASFCACASGGGCASSSTCYAS